MRRIDKLEPLTPHEFPVPAKELGVDQLALYTCGGAAHPDGSCDAHPAPPALVRALVLDAAQINAQIREAAWGRFHSLGMRGRLQR